MSAETDNVIDLALWRDPIAYLRDFYRDCSADVYVQIVAIHPDRGEIDAIAASKDSLESLRGFIDHYRSTHGLYHGVGALGSDPGKKAKREHVAEVPHVHVDADPRDGEDLQRERERILKLAQSIHPHPTKIVDSGRGFGFYFRIDKPVTKPAGGWADFEQRLNKKFIEVLHAPKGTHDVSRLMRLVGTTNFPNEKKRKGGYTEPATAKVVYSDDRAYSLEQLAAVRLRAEGLDDLELSDDARRTIRDGSKKYGGDNSRLLLAAVRFLRNAGADSTRILTICKDPNNACSVHALAQAEPDRAIERCIERVSDDQQDADEIIDEINREHATIWNGTKLVATREIFDSDGQLDDVKFVELWALEKFYDNTKRVLVGGKPVNRINYWLKHSKRRDCERIVLDPDDTNPKHINLFRGWAVEPNLAGSCDRWLEHVFENVADRDTTTFEYLLHWLADAIQRPTILPEVALVLLSAEEGTGKGTFVQGAARIYGPHFRQFKSTQEFLGRFNAQLKRALLVFADEATWGGDKQSRGKLYGLVTERTITIEEKFKDASQMKNHVRLIIASNMDWAIPAGVDSRRFCVLRVSDRHAGNLAYFNAIYDELAAGGYGKLLHMLQTRDLSSVNLRKFPRTEALLEQKLENAGPELKFLFHLASEGILPLDTQASGRINKRILFEALVRFTTAIGMRYPGTPEKFGKFLNHWVQPATKDVGKRSPELSARDYQFPDLVTTRARITEKFKQKVDWPEEPTEWQSYSEF